MSMPSKREIDDIERRYRSEIPLLTAKSDILVREADALDFRANSEPDNLKSLSLSRRASDKRLQAAKLLSEVDRKNNYLKMYGR